MIWDVFGDAFGVFLDGEWNIGDVLGMIVPSPLSHP